MFRRVGIFVVDRKYTNRVRYGIMATVWLLSSQILQLINQ